MYQAARIVMPWYRVQATRARYAPKIATLLASTHLKERPVVLSGPREAT